MSFVGFRVAAALLAVVAVPLLCQPVSAADGKRPGTAAAVKAEPAPSGSEVVGKLLKEQNGPSDPDVPLPKRDLGLTQTPSSAPLSGPQIFGRQEDGGGVMGLKFPIGVARGTN